MADVLKWAGIQDGTPKSNCKLIVDRDALRLFVGKWEEVKNLGENVDPVLTKMNISWFKRTGYKVSVLVNELLLDDGCENLTVVNSLWGIEKRYTLPLDGTVVELKDNEVGMWYVSTVFIDDEIVSTRVSEDYQVEMITIRKILPAQADGAIFLEHRVVLKVKGDTDTPMYCKRIFKKIK